MVFAGTKNRIMIATMFAATGLLVSGTTEITVYNQGLGFVKDVRIVKLAKGRQDVVVEDVAQLIDATSVGFKCLSNPGSVSILEQNYRYDLISPEAILAKSVGKRVRFTRSVGNSRETLEGILLSSPTSIVSTGEGNEVQYNGLVIKTDDGRIVLSPEGEVDVMEIPAGLISKPSLLWNLESDDEQEAKMELSYLTKGISWTANYVLTLDSKSTADIQGWVTLNNQCGVNFEDAKLNLLAGDVNVFRDEQYRYAYGARAKSETTAGLRVQDGFAEKSLFEYHLYTLQRPATVKNKEQKQLSLLQGSSIPVKKVVQFDASADSNGASTQDLGSSVRIKFINDKKSNLGMPMPAGKVRLYQRDKNGSVQFLGEDSIQHTPKDEKLDLLVGKAFDIKATQKRISYTKVNKHLLRMSFEVELRNRKTTDETITLNESMLDDWKITETTGNYVKANSNLAAFTIPVKANQVKSIKFTVEVKI